MKHYSIAIKFTGINNGRQRNRDPSDTPFRGCRHGKNGADDGRGNLGAILSKGRAVNESKRDYHWAAGCNGMANIADRCQVSLSRTYSGCWVKSGC